MAKPGVMFYFEIRPCIKRLTLEEKGQLFESILDYGEYGAIPEVDGAVGVAWDFIQQRIDRDTGRYDEKVDQTKYAVAVRESKKKGIQLPPFENWRLLSEEERERLLSDDIESYPTSKSISKSTSISKEKIESMADKPLTPTKAPQKTYGEFGWVKLTDDEFNRLSNDLGEAEVRRCIAYVDESAQTTGNKNKWKDWNLVVRKCHNQGWGLNQQKGGSNGRFEADALAQYGHIGTRL